MSNPELRSVTRVLSAKRMVRATRRKTSRGNKMDIVVTIGPPNYAERAAIKKATKNGASFPIKLVRAQKR